MIPLINTLKHKETWRYKHELINVEIVHWGVPTMNDGKGVWNYYLYILERHFSQVASLWLTPKYERYSAASPLRRLFDISPLAQIEIHGGISFYEQHDSDLPGQRVIQIGCDYNHLFDDESGHPENFESVLTDSFNSVLSLLNFLQSI